MPLFSIYNSRVSWSIFIFFLSLGTEMNTLQSRYEILNFTLTVSSHFTFPPHWILSKFCLKASYMHTLTGMVTSGCLPIFASGSFQGVTCIDIPLDTLFSPIIDFHLGRLSYAFLVDSRGRVLLHPLLPKLENYKQEPLFIDMESVEISNETPVIKRSMIRWRLVLFEIG